MAVRYFAYGSNMLSARLRARCPTAEARGIASVEGYRLGFCKRGRDGSGKAGFAPCADGARLYGVVYELDEADLSALDRIEGVGLGYDRVDGFTVQTGSAPLAVATYVADARFVHPVLKPFDWYLRLVLAGALEHGLPDTYVAAIEAVPFLVDPDAGRPGRLEAMRLLQAPEPAARAP
jgi:gamma-glutamylcyclotransferase (GGCT)/AIG2-like uncharacterized protein YtfP